MKQRKEKGDSEEEREEDKQRDEELSRVRTNLFYKIPLLKKLNMKSLIRTKIIILVLVISVGLNS